MSTFNTSSSDDQNILVIDNKILLSLAQKRYFASNECAAAREALEQLVHNPAYNIDSIRKDENDESFIDRHLQYLSKHPQTGYQAYMTNLRLATSIKRI